MGGEVEVFIDFGWRRGTVCLSIKDDKVSHWRYVKAADRLYV